MWKLDHVCYIYDSLPTYFLFVHVADKEALLEDNVNA